MIKIIQEKPLQCLYWTENKTLSHSYLLFSYTDKGNLNLNKKTDLSSKIKYC